MPRYTLESLIGLLIALWILGWLVIPVAGGLIHLLLLIVLVLVIVRVLQGRGV